MDALYGFGIDSMSRLRHHGDVNFNYETDTSIFSIGTRMDYYPDTSYFYILPSVGGKFRAVDWLAVFNKIFLSWDNQNFFSGSYWAELEWIINPSFFLRTGATLSWADFFGYSILAGMEIAFTPSVRLKYSFQFMSTTIDNMTQPVEKYGIANNLLLDIRF